MYQSRWKSPIVWITTLSVVLLQLQQLSEKPVITVFDICILVLTAGIAFLGAINNPTDPKRL